jgi:leader peptidase (prepilin peptidase) / N-methyltransferase
MLTALSLAFLAGGLTWWFRRRMPVWADVEGIAGEDGRCQSLWVRIGRRRELEQVVAMLPPVLAGLVGPSLELVLILTAVGWILGWLLIYDLRSLRLPDPLTLPLLLFGLVEAALRQPDHLADRALAALLAGSMLILTAELYQRWRGKAGLGRGDAKLFAAIAAWSGLESLGAVLLGASLSAIMTVIAVDRLAGTQLRKAPIPFGVFLVLSGYAALLQSFG